MCGPPSASKPLKSVTLCHGHFPIFGNIFNFFKKSSYKQVGFLLDKKSWHELGMNRPFMKGAGQEERVAGRKHAALACAEYWWHFLNMNGEVHAH